MSSASVIRRTSLRVMMLALTFVVCASTEEQKAFAEDSPRLEAAVLAYLHHQGYHGATFPNGPFAESLPWARHYKCLSRDAIAVVPYGISGSDGGGMAIVAIDSGNPSAYNVLMTGGGAVDAGTLESFGLPASEARDFIRHLSASRSQR